MSITVTSDPKHNPRGTTEFHITMDCRARRKDRNEIVRAFCRELDRQLRFDDGDDEGRAHRA